MDDADREEQSGETPLHYRLCPRCFRAVPARSGERYCINDGARMLDACPQCGAAITSPYSRFCAGCGRPFAAPASPPQP